MSEKKYPSDKLDKFMLRFPKGMREQIKQAADASGRSMNAEIVHRLEESFKPASEALKEAPDFDDKFGKKLSECVQEVLDRELSRRFGDPESIKNAKK